MTPLLKYWPIIVGMASVVGSGLFLAYSTGGQRSDVSHELNNIKLTVNEVKLQNNTLLMQVNDLSTGQQALKDSVSEIKNQINKVDKNGQLTNKVLSRHVERTDLGNEEMRNYWKDLLKLQSLDIDSVKKKTYLYAIQIPFTEDSQMLNSKLE